MENRKFFNLTYACIINLILLITRFTKLEVIRLPFKINKFMSIIFIDCLTLQKTSANLEIEGLLFSQKKVRGFDSYRNTSYLPYFDLKKIKKTEFIDKDVDL